MKGSAVLAGLGSSLRQVFRRFTIWQLLLTFVVMLYVVYFTTISLDRHHSLGTSTYDLGLYEQGLWLLSQGKAPFVTLMGRNLFGDHSSFILVALAPIYRLFPNAGTLFFVQSLVIGLGAVPIFLTARRRLASEAMAFVLAVCYLLHPAVGWTNLENFHPDCFLALFVGMAIYAALESKWRLYWVFVVLTLLVKEDVVLVVLPLAVWVAMRSDRRRGAATAFATVSATLIAMFLVMRSLIGVPTRNAWRIPFGGPSGLAREVVARPGNVIEHLRSDSRPFYLWQMTFPMAFVFLKRPGVAAISAIVLFTNVLSTFWYQYHIEYHYSLIAVPAIILGTVYALEQFGRRGKRRLVGAVAVTSVWSCLMWGTVPVGAILMPGAQDPIGRDLRTSWSPDDEPAIAAREMFALIPAEASVSADHSLTPHLANREQIYQFPNPFRVVLYGVGDSLEDVRACLPAADNIEYVLLEAPSRKANAVWLMVGGDFEAVAHNDFWVLYHRVGHSVSCELSSRDGYRHLVNADRSMQSGAVRFVNV